MLWNSLLVNPSLILCLLLCGLTANCEEKPPTWKEARAAWKKTGVWLYDENFKPTKSAKDVRTVWYFDAHPDNLMSLPYLKALPDPKRVILDFSFMEPEQTSDLVDSAKRLPPLKGIKVRYVWTDMTDTDLCLVSKIVNLRDLTLYGDALKLTDAGMKCLGERCKLTMLRLSSHDEHYDVTDEGLAHLKAMDSLSQISLRHARIQGPGLRHLEKLPVTSLNLTQCPTNDTCWIPISKMRSLEVLNLFETEVTGSGIEHLKDLPKLIKLTLADTKVTAENVALLAECRRLTDLSLAFTGLDDEAIPHLAKLKQLKNLSLLKTKLTKTGVERLSKLLPDTEIFY